MGTNKKPSKQPKKKPKKNYFNLDNNPFEKIIPQVRDYSVKKDTQG